MKKKVLLIIGSIILIGIIILIILKSPRQEKYFNQIILNDNNVAVINMDKPYYDTIIKVGLDEVSLKDIKVVVIELTDASKSQFDGGDLKAHIRYHEGVYYLFIGDYDRNESIDIISHEIIHITQYYSGKLNYTDGQLVWDDRVYDLNNVIYENRPWEVEAFDKQKQLSNRIKERLYN